MAFSTEFYDINNPELITCEVFDSVLLSASTSPFLFAAGGNVKKNQKC